MTQEDLELKQKKINVAIAELDRKHGLGSVVRLGNDDIQKIPHISTGALTLDLALGLGGVPEGRIVEIYGPESSGKSTIACSIVREAQKLGKTCVYIDAEQALDPVYAKALGINLDDLYLCQPDYGEKAFDIMEHLVKTDAVDVVIVDSVAALMPKEELEGDMESKQMGAQARMMSKGLRKINHLLTLGESKTLIVFINQLRQKIGIMFGNPETTPGGLALKYAASVRIDLRKIEDIKDGNGFATGSKVRARVIKNKVGPPLRVAEFDIEYGKGVNTVGCILDLAVEREYVLKKGAWYANAEGETFAQGRTKAIEWLQENPEIVAKLKEMILDEGL